mmetsp:Transcript_47761/g.113678  ORF Transcript_47761/g.113678 Transcript_47761/m.113678 type:complete len:296 (-) Transcript_47761:209-1096(-)
MPHHAPLLEDGALDSLEHTVLDERQVLLVRCRRACEVARLLHHSLLGADFLADLLREVLARVDKVEFGVPERIPGDLLPGRLHALDDVVDARPLGDEQVHAVVLVHDGAEALALCLQVHRHLRDVDPVDVELVAVEAEARDHVLRLELLAVRSGGRRREPPAVPPHHLVDDEHTRARRVLVHHVAEEERPLLRGGLGAERQPDGVHVVVDRLREADNRERVVVLPEVGGEVSGGRVGVVAADGVQHVDPEFDQHVRRDLLGVFPLLDEPTLHAILSVGQLDARVADRRAAVVRQH